jgi:hypothetical protein
MVNRTGPALWRREPTHARALLCLAGCPEIKRRSGHTPLNDDGAALAKQTARRKGNCDPHRKKHFQVRLFAIGLESLKAVEAVLLF